MNKNKLEVTSQQLIQFLGTNICKYSGTFETYEKGKSISNEIGILEGYFLIVKNKSKDCLYLKTWLEEKDISYNNALYDSSNKVEDIIFEENLCTFFLSYTSQQGIVNLTIEKKFKDDPKYSKMMCYYKLIPTNQI